MMNPSEKKVKTPMPGHVLFGEFRARQVPKSNYERPSKKKQAQNLKSANKSFNSEEEVNCQLNRSPLSQQSYENSAEKENYSLNPQCS